MLTLSEMDEVLRSADDITAARRGGNSTVTRVEFGERVFAVKDYSGRTDGIRRMGREFDSLVFLERNVIPGFSRPLARDESSCRAVYTWVPGVTPILNFDTVNAMLEVFERLHHLACDSTARSIGPATDAASTPAEILHQVEERSRELFEAGGTAVREVLATDIAPAKRLLSSRVLDFGAPTRTLSLSDCGTHNMLQDDVTTAMYFIDLEFFGHDDATKLVCDTLLHPQATWGADTAKEFVEGCLRVFGLAADRIWTYLPYFSLKWSLVILARAQREICAHTEGDVVPEAGQRALDLARRFASRASEDGAGIAGFSGR